MIPNPWIILAVILAWGASIAGVGYWQRHDGALAAKLDAAGRDAARVDKIIVRDRIVEKEVPKIVEKVVTRTVTVTKEVDRVVTKIEHDIPADCVLPDRYGLFLVAAARGLDPDAPGVTDALSGAYGCREVLAATLHDLKAGWINSARLEGLQTYERTANGPMKGGAP